MKLTLQKNKSLLNKKRGLKEDIEEKQELKLLSKSNLNEKLPYYIHCLTHLKRDAKKWWCTTQTNSFFKYYSVV